MGSKISPAPSSPKSSILRRNFKLGTTAAKSLETLLPRFNQIHDRTFDDYNIMLLEHLVHSSTVTWPFSTTTKFKFSLRWKDGRILQAKGPECHFCYQNLRVTMFEKEEVGAEAMSREPSHFKIHVIFASKRKHKTLK